MDQRTSSSGGGNLAAAQLRVYNPFLCQTAAEFPPPKMPDCRRSIGGSPEEEKGTVLPELSCRAAAELPTPAVGRRRSRPAEAEASAAVRQLRQTPFIGDR